MCCLCGGGIYFHFLKLACIAVAVSVYVFCSVPASLLLFLFSFSCSLFCKIQLVTVVGVRTAPDAADKDVGVAAKQTN